MCCPQHDGIAEHKHPFGHGVAPCVHCVQIWEVLPDRNPTQHHPPPLYNGAKQQNKWVKYSAVPTLVRHCTYPRSNQAPKVQLCNGMHEVHMLQWQVPHSDIRLGWCGHP